MKSIERQVLKDMIMDVLRTNPPQTVGDLFLRVKHSHEVVKNLLRELRAEGLAESKTMEVHTTSYHGAEMRYIAMHWYPKPVSVPASPSKRQRKA